MIQLVHISNAPNLYRGHQLWCALYMTIASFPWTQILLNTHFILISWLKRMLLTCFSPDRLCIWRQLCCCCRLYIPILIASYSLIFCCNTDLTRFCLVHSSYFLDTFSAMYLCLLRLFMWPSSSVTLQCFLIYWECLVLTSCSNM
jgi:hypothetical protein